jgi:hypothetical protein
VRLHMPLDLAALRKALLAAFVPLAVLPAAYESVGISLLHGLDVVLANVDMQGLGVCEYPATGFTTLVVAPETSVCLGCNLNRTARAAM